MRLIKAIKGESVDRIPFWFMRQAGRYLPEYRKLKGNDDFLTLAKNVEKAIEISIQPYRRFRMDGIILFADILTPLEGAGIPVVFKEKEGPVVDFDIHQKTGRNLLKDFMPEKHVPYIGEILQGIVSFRNSIQEEKPAILGFAGAPFTLLCYLIERKTAKNFETVKAMLFLYEELIHEVLEDLTRVVIEYLEFQIRNGADAVQIFDSWGGILSSKHYREFSYPYIKKIIGKIAPKVPVIVFTGNNAHLLDELVSLQPQAISLDWRVQNIASIPEDIAIQGNLDPSILLGSQKRVVAETLHVLENFSSRKRFVFNLGHGILPDTPLHNVEAMVETIKSYPLQSNF